MFKHKRCKIKTNTSIEGVIKVKYLAVNTKLGMTKQIKKYLILGEHIKILKF